MQKILIEKKKRKIKVEIPKIAPSVNLAYFNIKTKQGRMMRVKKQAAKDFINLTHSLCDLNKPIDGKIKVEAWFYFPDKRKHDLGNMDKITMDALEGKFITDDNNIYRLCFNKEYDKENPRTIIEIEEL